MDACQMGFLVMLVSFLPSIAASILVGDTLNVGSNWTSPRGTFAIGLREVREGTTGNSDLQLAIWYSMANETIVWKALTKFLLNKKSRIQVELSRTMGLVVLDSHSNNPIWQSSPGSCCIKSAYMEETGNFIIKDTEDQSVWESFDNPTDTLLPHQQLSGSTELKSNSGSYTLVVNRAQVFLRCNMDGMTTNKYWGISSPLVNSTQSCLDNENGEQVIGTCSPDLSLLKAPPTLNLTSEGMLKFYDGSGESWYKSQTQNFQRYALDYGRNVSRRVTLSDDGNLRMFSMDIIKNSWSVVWQAVLKECAVFGACGKFALCTYRPHKTCICPPGFHKVDPSDDSKGCDYDAPVTCTSSNKLVAMNRVDYFYNDYDFKAEVTTIKSCKESCLKDCECLAVAYKFNGFGLCFHKGHTFRRLYNGAQSFDMDNVFFIKVRADQLTLEDDHIKLGLLYTADTNATVLPHDNSSSMHTHNNVQRIVLSIALGELGLFAGFATMYWFYWRRCMHKMRKEIEEGIQGAPMRFTFREIQTMTRDFHDMLGSGGFGAVYKGELPEQGGVVAVKVIEAPNATQAEKQFKAEVNTIGRLHHVNLVRLLGYCAEGSRRMLVYEYMPNSSLDKVLFDNDNATTTSGTKEFCSWNMRYSISLGIAKGVSYLHEECHECVVHCDIKPQNVLLDEDFVPKISDFGLAKLVTKDFAFSVTTIRGTRGYVAPEWLHNKQVTTKVDVFSYGMMLFDILSGRASLKLTPFAMETDEWYFPTWAFHRLMESDLKSIADTKLGNDVDWTEFERLLKVALWCTQLDAASRPSMPKVVQMLEGNMQVPAPQFPDIDC